MNERTNEWTDEWMNEIQLVSVYLTRLQRLFSLHEAIIIKKDYSNKANTNCTNNDVTLCTCQ